MGDLRELALKTQDVYERKGARFDAERSKTLFERQWLDRLLEVLPSNPRVLDAGCGAGDPIARYLIEKGCCLTGIDFSRSLIEIATARFPQAQWHIVDMCSFCLPDRFDGILAWHSFFHLTPDDQLSTLARFGQHLTSGGALMFTAGHIAGEVIGHVGGEEVYHSSLSPKQYETVLNRLGLRVLDFVPEDPSCGGATVLLAQKRRITS